MSLRRALSFLSLASIVAMCIAPALLCLPFIDRAPYARSLAGIPDRRWPRYPGFLEGVRAHTRPGDSIALMVPTLRWDDEYSYAYYRASYFLPGREVLPLAGPQNVRFPQNLRAARYVALFGAALHMPADIIWRGEGGMLVRLRR